LLRRYKVAKTSRINLNITSASDDTKRFRDFRTELAGDADDSNMVVIDREIGKLQDKVIFSAVQPGNQEDGDVWNEELQ
jgi:hypothetical protein